MSLTFPTTHVPSRNWPARPGEPTRARHCRCIEGSLVDKRDDPDQCTRCGHYTNPAISATWANRAAEIAANRRPRRKAA